MKKLLFMVAAILVFASAPKVLMAAPAVMAEQAATEDVVDKKLIGLIRVLTICGLQMK